MHLCVTGLGDAYTDEVREAYTLMWELVVNVETTILSVEDPECTPKAGNAKKV